MPDNAADMLLLAVLLLAPQRLDPPKHVSYVGEAVVLRAVDRSGEPAAGVPIRVLIGAAGDPVAIGKTDSGGELRYVPRVAGRFEFQGEFADCPLVIAVYHVAERPARWLYAVLLTPLGLLLLWLNLRRWRRPASVTSASRSAP